MLPSRKLLGLNLMERIKFKITFVRFYSGSGPIGSQFKSEEVEKPINNGEPFIYLEMKDYNRKFRKILGKRPVTAFIYRHTTGVHKNSEGQLINGQLDIGCLPPEDENEIFVEVVGLLKAHAFDTIVSSILSGGKELLSKSKLSISLKDDLGDIKISKPGSMFLLEDLCINFEVGEKYDELQES